MIITVTNLNRIFKKKANLIIMFIFPLIFITLLMIGSFSVQKTTIGLVDNDNTKLTRILSDSLKGQNNIVLLKEKDIKSRLVSSSIDYGMIIDKGFTARVIAGKDVSIRGFSIKESNISLPSKYYIESFINSARNIGAASKGDEKLFYKGINSYENGVYSVSYKDIVKSNNKGESTLRSFGFLIMSMLYIGTMTTQLILEDKKNKIYYRIFASPVSPRSYMLQNILSSFSTLLIQLVIIFAIMKFVFKAYFGPSLLTMFGLFAVFALVCVSLGVAISSISKDVRQAGSINSFITVPMCMLGGCFWTRDFMPDILVRISNFMPTTWVLKAAGKLIDGGSLSSIYTDLSVLLLFILVFALMGSWKKEDITK